MTPNGIEQYTVIFVTSVIESHISLYSQPKVQYWLKSCGVNSILKLSLPCDSNVCEKETERKIKIKKKKKKRCMPTFRRNLGHPIQHFPSVNHRRRGTLNASAPRGCDISRYHRIHVRHWPNGGCDTHDTEVS